MRKVLVADDDESLRALLKVTLCDSRFEVLYASAGSQALTMYQEHQPELLILDIAMPGLSGLDVCRAVKAGPAADQTRVIILTARRQVQDEQLAVSAGADMFMTKPFSPLQLLRVVDQLLPPG